jgi:hypothetical protein
MKITICGSVAFINQMAEVAKQLESLGHDVKFPPIAEPLHDGTMVSTEDYYKLKKSGLKNDDPFWKTHDQRIRNHFDKVEWCDAILVTNYDKNGIEGYIGPNTLMEMGLAFYLKKPIYLLNKIPEISYLEEILGVKPIVLEGDLLKI